MYEVHSDMTESEALNECLTHMTVTIPEPSATHLLEVLYAGCPKVRELLRVKEVRMKWLVRVFNGLEMRHNPQPFLHFMERMRKEYGND